MKFILLIAALIGANIMGNKGILFHKYLKQGYDAVATEWHEADKKP